LKSGVPGQCSDATDLPELVTFAAGISLRIVQAPHGGWRVSDGRVETLGGTAIVVAEVIPPLAVTGPLHRSREDAIAAAAVWVATLA
jgi:hypothetical protein